MLDTSISKGEEAVKVIFWLAQGYPKTKKTGIIPEMLSGVTV